MKKKPFFLKLLWAFNVILFLLTAYITYYFLFASEPEDYFSDLRKVKLRGVTNNTGAVRFSALGSSNIVSIHPALSDIVDSGPVLTADAQELLNLIEVVGKFPSGDDPARQAAIIKLLFIPGGETVAPVKPKGRVRKNVNMNTGGANVMVPVFYNEIIKYDGEIIEELEGWVLKRVNDYNVVFTNGKTDVRIPVVDPFGGLPDGLSSGIIGATGSANVSISGPNLNLVVTAEELASDLESLGITSKDDAGSVISRYIRFTNGVEFIKVPGNILPKFIAKGDQLYSLNGQPLKGYSMERFARLFNDTTSDFESGKIKQLVLELATRTGSLKKYIIQLQ